jgi:hypothetical protein
MGRRRVIDAKALALLDLLSRGYLAPARDDPAYERLMGEWTQRYRARLEAATRLLDAVAAIEAEEPACSPSK